MVGGVSIKILLSIERHAWSLPSGEKAFPVPMKVMRDMANPEGQSA
jgi:hypothetical protein